MIERWHRYPSDDQLIFPAKKLLIFPWYASAVSDFQPKHWKRQTLWDVWRIASSLPHNELGDDTRKDPKQNAFFLPGKNMFKGLDIY